MRTTHLDPITAEHPSDVRDIVSPEDGQLQVRSLLQSLAGDGSYPYVGSFELPMGPRSEVERAAKRIAAELRRALRATGMSAASATPVLFGVNREAGITLRACKAPGLGPTGSQ